MFFQVPDSVVVAVVGKDALVLETVANTFAGAPVVADCAFVYRRLLPAIVPFDATSLVVVFQAIVMLPTSWCEAPAVAPKTWAVVTVVTVLALSAFVAFVAFVALVAVAALPPMLNPAAVPVMFVPTKADGVPKLGVTRVGLLDSTTLPVPVEDVTPVPPFATGSVPVTPVVRGRPVTLVITPLAGVPSAGVTSTGLVSVGDVVSALVAIATEMLLNSVLISVPLTILSGSPDGSESLVAKLVLCV